MNQNETQNKVKEILESQLNCKVDVASTRATLSQWDSLKHISIVFELEDVFCVHFSEEEFSALNSLKAITKKIMSKKIET